MADFKETMMNPCIVRLCIFLNKIISAMQGSFLKACTPVHHGSMKFNKRCWVEVELLWNIKYALERGGTILLTAA